MAKMFENFDNFEDQQSLDTSNQVAAAKGDKRTTDDSAKAACSKCGIVGKRNGKPCKYTATTVGETVANAAIKEWKRWQGAKGRILEGDPQRFGDLVEYWLAPTDSLPNSKLARLRNVFTGRPWQRFSADATGTSVWQIPLPSVSNPTKWAGDVASAIPKTPRQPTLGALIDARKSHFDTEKVGWRAWSAAFILACVRAAEIDLGISDPHQLLKRNIAHYRYARHALKLRQTKATKKYLAFAPRAHKPRLGDIIVQDRSPAGTMTWKKFNNKATRPTNLTTHGDIVVKVAGDHVIAIGGNLEIEPDQDQTGSVRKRKYPLSGGKLQVAHLVNYQQEDDSGAMGDLRADFVAKKLKRDDISPHYRAFVRDKNGRPVVDGNRSAKDQAKLKKKMMKMPPRSTRRIFTLLRLVDDCDDTKKRSDASSEGQNGAAS